MFSALPMAEPARPHCHAASHRQVATAPSVSRCHRIQRGERTSCRTPPRVVPVPGPGARHAVVQEAPVASLLMTRPSTPAVRAWLRPSPPDTAPITDPRVRRLVGTEVLVVLTVTLGLSAARSALSLIDALLQPVPLNEQQVALNAPAAQAELVDLAAQLLRVLQLVGWGALGGYLLVRAGFALRRSGWTRAARAGTRWAPPAWPR